MLYKIFRRASFSEYNITLFVIAVAFIVTGSFIFWTNSSFIEEANVESVSLRMLVLARSGSQSIENVLASLKVQLILLSERSEIANKDLKNATILMKRTIATANLPFTQQLGLVDADGTLRAIVNREDKKTNEGNSLSDRDYFIWAKNAREGDIFLSKPILGRSGINKGTWVLVLATPLLTQDGKFNGVLFSSLRLDDLTTNYINNLKTTSEISATVINNEGNIAISNSSKLIGENVFAYANDKKWNNYQTYTSYMNDAVSDSYGSGIYFFLEPNGKLDKWISAFSRAEINGRFITIEVATPLRSTLQVVQEFLKNQLIWIIYIVFLCIITTFLWTLSVHLARRDGYNVGLKHGAKNQRGR